VVIVSVAVVVLGAMAMLVARQWMGGGTVAEKIVDDLGSLLIATGLISLAWDLWAKRTLIDEVMATARLGEQVTTSGLTATYADFSTIEEWKDLFDGSESLDLCFMYARSWLGSHVVQLNEFAKKDRWAVRAFMPDPEDPTLMTLLGAKLEIPADDVRKRILESERELRDTFKAADGKARSLSVWFYKRYPVISFYRFSQAAVFSFYKHRRGRGDVPGFVVKRGGTLYRFIEAEIDAFTSEGIARESLLP
jgi:hypothetical protein